MKLTSHAARRLAAAAITCIAIVLPTAALASAGSAAVAGSAAATTSSEAPAGAGHPAAVPAGFLPSSASFYSPAAGVVLGGVGCLPGMPCRARLVATTDSGARWRSVKAPSVPVTVVLFASARDGWLYGPTGSQGQRVGGLWATHDRGERIFPIHAPVVDHIDVVRTGRVRRDRVRGRDAARWQARGTVRQPRWPQRLGLGPPCHG